MLFNSVSFAGFLAATYFLWLAARGRWRHFVLLVASYAFYASWNPPFVLLLVFSTLLDFHLGQALGTETRPTRRKLFLLLSLVGNLGVLIYFKYAHFFLASLGLAEWAGTPSSQVFHVYGAIPLGISFYTFQTLSYTIDVYRGTTPVCRSVADFALYVSFFPQLVAGPILRSDEFLPQLRPPRMAAPEAAVQGAELFVLGLVKKAVIADNIGLAVDLVFSDPGGYTGPSLFLGAALFWAQVYCDFSGYSTMARGLAKMFGFEMPRNFDYPLLASNPLEYRRGWHITMSKWFRDYVFFPLGGSRCRPARVALNILIVWGLFGLWHGAAWTFLLWGLYNGVIQATYREMLRRGFVLPDFPGKRWAGTLLNFLIVVPSSLFFRATSSADSLSALGRVVTLSSEGQSLALGWWGWLAALATLHVLSYRYYDENLLSRLSWPARMVLLGGAAVLLVLATPESRPFIYFQF